MILDKRSSQTVLQTQPFGTAFGGPQEGILLYSVAGIYVIFQPWYNIIM